VLTPGNRKLGGSLIWGFGLPSGRLEICLGLSPDCLGPCYARHLERLRPTMLARYEANLALSRQRDFVLRACCFILAHDIQVVRIHIGGDFYSVVYARRWRRIIRRLPQVRFFFYSRSWRDAAIRRVLEKMALLSNCRVWYSCDRGTGLPENLPAQVRLAWLMTAADDLPPATTHLVFRVRRLRRQQRTRINGVRVCPAEDGVQRRRPVTCDNCRLCWRPLPEEGTGRRLALPLLPPNPSP
jgi:Gene product 88